MQRALFVTVRLHEGRYHGLDNRGVREWPPAPARVFQAMLSGAARGAAIPPATQEALDWLETLPPPVVTAPRGSAGQDYLLYVPNNDLDAVLSGRRFEDAVAGIRVGKRIRPTLFDASVPICYCWWLGDDDTHAPALCAAAHGIYQLGRGVDMAWAEAAVVDADEAARRISRGGGNVYRPSEHILADRGLLCARPGSRLSLASRFERTRVRFRLSGTVHKPVRAFVQPPKPLLRRVTYEAEAHRLAFELREADARAAYAGWSLSGAVELVESARDKAAESLRAAVPELAGLVDRYLIGRNAREKDKSSRVRIVPIPSVGHEHVDMSIRRLSIRVPQTCPLAREDVAWAFSRVAWSDGEGTIVRELQRADDDRMVSRFERRVRRWQSVTPLALPMARRRRIDPGRQAEQAKGGAERAAEEGRAVAAVHHALRHAGIGVPVARVRVQREPFERQGIRAEWFSPGTRFPKETLWHAAITFTEPVAGPLLLGDGRFVGLGLMRPYDGPARGVIAFAIAGGLADRAEPAAVAHAARRAMMARVQAGMRRGATLPTYVSGHLPDGAPARDGTHRHVAVVADLPRERILYIAPSELQRGGVRWREVAAEHRRAADAVEGMDVLRAGRAGCLTLVPAVVDPDSDPLFAPARVWESVTTYDVARHHRGLSAEDALRQDAGAEIDRCGWPRLRPDSIEVLAVRHGPRGGLSGRLRLTFRTAQAGPLLIGRTAHKGGGLFAGC